MIAYEAPIVPEGPSTNPLTTVSKSGVGIGCGVGGLVGAVVGFLVGTFVGEFVGVSVFVGSFVGSLVGALEDVVDGRLVTGAFVKRAGALVTGELVT